MEKIDSNRVYLKNYQKPLFYIDRVDLEFDILEHSTIVQSRLRLKKARSSEGNLELVGDDLELLEIRHNGDILSESAYALEGNKLTIFSCTLESVIEIKTKIFPDRNTVLRGLYRSGAIYCTQCEPEGFRRITYFIDRPDNMSLFTCKITANKDSYPSLLSNGNLIEQGEAEEGRHWVKWADPIPKPCYLFALVAGHLSLALDEYTTTSGKKVKLKLYVDPGNQDRCSFALQSLKQAMAWDEKVYSLEYDLDIYMIVAVDTFNMGAMENKGLNIFNSSFVLGKPQTSTDEDFLSIQAIVAHEYFHNWSGNRVTCRDWFQLTLKEGLTVFREQQFCQDVYSLALQRMKDVRNLEETQFPEDSSPFAHPIRPESYIEINNFFTPTVYDKGAEVIRVMYQLMGEKAFFEGMRKYFELFDAQAVTTEDFVQVLKSVSGDKLSGIETWYHQAGTPILKVELKENEKSEKILEFSQKLNQKANGDLTLKPQIIPLRFALIGLDHNTLTLSSKIKIQGNDLISELRDWKLELNIGQVNKPFVLSLNRGFCAPVKVCYSYSLEERAFLAINETDPFNQFMAIDSFWLEVYREENLELSFPWIKKLLNQLLSKEDQPHLLASALSLPSEKQYCQTLDEYSFEDFYQRKNRIEQFIAQEFKEKLEELYDRASKKTLNYDFTPEAIGFRSLKSKTLSFLVLVGEEELLWNQYQNANCMEDKLNCLHLAIELESKFLDPISSDFYQLWHQDNSVIDKWINAWAEKMSDIQYLQKLVEIEEDTVFNYLEPNKIRALLRSFAMLNFKMFHHESGQGYSFILDRIKKIDQKNPQAASRLLKCFCDVEKYGQKRKDYLYPLFMKLSQGNLSKDSSEVLEGILKTYT